MLPAETLLVIGIVGGITTVVTGLIALGENDLKRLLAASTSSQYGLMLLAVGAGVPLAALLHLIAHAAIKSSLFLGAGVFQHSRDSTDFSDLVGAIIAASLASPNALMLTTFAVAGTLLTGTYMARALSILWHGDVVRPAFAIARGCEKLERSLYTGVLAVGRLGLYVGRGARLGDERGIDGLIFSLVRGTVNLGNRARTLQSGLIHREMAISVVGAALILIILFVPLLFY